MGLKIEPTARQRAGLRQRGAVRHRAVPAAGRQGDLRVLLGPEGPGVLHVPRMTGMDLDELVGITDPFGGIDKAKARKLGYEVLPGDAWIEQEVDILIPPRIENQITGRDRRRRSSPG